MCGSVFHRDLKMLVSYDDGLAGFDHVELRQALQDLAQRLLAQRGVVPSPPPAALFLTLLAARRLPTCGGREQNVTCISYLCWCVFKVANIS